MLSLNNKNIELKNEKIVDDNLYNTNFLKNIKFNSDYFYFRLSNKNLYYSDDNKDMIVKGAISI